MRHFLPDFIFVTTTTFEMFLMNVVEIYVGRQLCVA